LWFRQLQRRNFLYYITLATVVTEIHPFTCELWTRHADSYEGPTCQVPSASNVNAQPIGVGTGKFLGVLRIFVRLSPNLPEKFCFFATFAYKFSPAKIMKTFFGCDPPKKVFVCFSAKVGGHFVQIFRSFVRIFREFARFSKNLPIFSGICSDFWQIKTFRGALAPPPPTPLP